MDDIEKTIPPERRRVADSNMDEMTMPGKRDRKPDGRFAIGDLIMNRYKVLAELGQGGMGVVYKCFDETAGIEVALKALPPELSHNTLEMEDIKDNFQLVAKLVHQNIAISKNLEKDNSNGNYYLIMECCEGEDLRRWLKRKRREGNLTLDDVLPIIKQVAEALDYAHKQKIIHRDIKPGNIMINQNGDIKVLDFGLAAQIHTSMTRVSMAYHGTSGTGPYMAPEQWRGRAQSAPADQYALAVMTYEMLAGHLPFESTDAAVLREAVLNDTPEEIADIPNTAQDAINRGMSKNPAERFASCIDFFAALTGKKIKSAKTANKNTGSFKWVAMLLIALLLGAGGVGYYYLTQTKNVTVTETAAEPVVQPAPATPSPAKPQKTEVELDAEYAQLKSDIENAIKELDNTKYDRGQTFGEKIDQTHKNFQASNNAKMIATSIVFLKKAQANFNWIKTNAPKRDTVKKMLIAISEAQNKADKFEPLRFAAQTYKTAQKNYSDVKQNYESGNFDDAEIYAEKALQMFKTAINQAQKNKTEHFLSQARSAKGKKWDKVLQFAQKASEVDRNNSEAKHLISETKNNLAQVSSLLKTAQNAKSKNWDTVLQNAQAALNIESENAIAQQLAATAKEQIKKRNTLLAKAKQAATSADWQALLTCSKDIQSFEKNNTQAKEFYNQATQKIKEARLADALNRARAYQQKDWKGCLQFAQKALETAPENQEAKILISAAEKNLARISSLLRTAQNAKSKNWDTVLQNAQAALNIESENAIAQQLAATAKEQIKKRNTLLAKAKQAATSADWQALLTCSKDIQSFEKNNTQAKEFYNQATQKIKETRLADALNHARAYRQKDWKKCLQFAQKALKIDSGNREAYDLKNLATDKLLPRFAFNYLINGQKLPENIKPEITILKAKPGKTNLLKHNAEYAFEITCIYNNFEHNAKYSFTCNWEGLKTFDIELKALECTIVNNNEELKKAIASANDGDVIFIKAGQYDLFDKKPVLIQKAIRLLGENKEKTVISFNKKEENFSVSNLFKKKEEYNPGFEVSKSDNGQVRFENLTIESNCHRTPLRIKEKGTSYIKDCKIKAKQYCFYIENESTAKIQNCELTSSPPQGMSCIGISHSSTVHIKKCKISSLDGGITIHDKGMAIVEDCDITTQADAFYVGGVDAKSRLLVKNSVVKSHFANYAIYQAVGAIKISGCKFESKARLYCSGLDATKLYAENSIFILDEVGNYGCIISTNSAYFNNCQFIRKGYGKNNAGISVDDAYRAYVYNCTYTGDGTMFHTFRKNGKFVDSPCYIPSDEEFLRQ